jgi:hypothetical protein
MQKGGLSILRDALRNTDKKTWLRALKIGLKFGGIFLVAELIFFAAGFGIWMIAHGLWIIGSRLVIYWKPARRITSKYFFKSQEEQYLQMPPMPWYRWIYLFLYLAAATALIIFGVEVLVTKGFLGQNFFYLIAR